MSLIMRNYEGCNYVDHPFPNSVTMYTIKKKGEKPDRKPYPLPYGLSPTKKKEKRSLRTLKIMPRNLNESVR